MIMCTLLSMVYGLFKPCWLTHVICTCFKETALLFNVHLSCFVDFILCPTDKYMFKVNNKKNRLICWMCSKLKIDTAWHRSGVFLINFGHSQCGNIVFLLLTLNKYLSVWFERQVIMFWKYKNRHICFVIKVAGPISFSDLSFHQIELSYEQMIILWTYYEQIMNICFSSKFALGIPSVLSSFPPVILSAIPSLFPGDLIFFAASNRKPI